MKRHANQALTVAVGALLFALGFAVSAEAQTVPAQQVIGPEAVVLEPNQTAVWRPAPGVVIAVSLQCWVSGGHTDEENPAPPPPPVAGLEGCWLLLDGAPTVPLERDEGWLSFVRLRADGARLQGTFYNETGGGAGWADSIGGAIDLVYIPALGRAVYRPPDVGDTNNGGELCGRLDFVRFGCERADGWCGGVLEPSERPRAADRDGQCFARVAADQRAQRQRAQPGIHIVARGETVDGIARQRRIRVRDIVAWNPGLDVEHVRAGTRLQVAPP